MTNIKESAQAYEPSTTKNIADLEKVSVDIEIKEEEFTKKDSSETFKVNIIEVESEQYRVPTSVLAGLKAILEAKPDTKFFKVVKSGEGLNTTYQVMDVE